MCESSRPTSELDLHLEHDYLRSNFHAGRPGIPRKKVNRNILQRHVCDTTIRWSAKPRLAWLWSSSGVRRRGVICVQATRKSASLRRRSWFVLTLAIDRSEPRFGPMVKAFERIPRESSRLFASAMTLLDKEPQRAKTIYVGRWAISDFHRRLILRADYDTQQRRPLSVTNETRHLDYCYGTVDKKQSYNVFFWHFNTTPMT